MADEKNEAQEPQGSAHKEEIQENMAVSPEEPASDNAQQATSADSSAEDKLAQLEKDHLYLRAEMENIKRQNIKERSQLLKYGAERLARDLLDTLDVFKSALGGEVTAENFKETKEWKNAFSLF